MKKAIMGLTKNLNYLCLVGVVALGLMTIVATGGGDGGGGGTPSQGPPPAFVSISGRVSPPSGTSPTDFTAVSLGETSYCNSDGSFSAKAYTNGVTVVGAMHENGKMGLMNVVVTSSGTVSSVSSFRALSPDPIELDAKTTAVSMVFTSPLFLTSDPTRASSLLDIIENDPEVEILANVIESVFNEPDPLENTTLQEALGDALRSVLDTVISETSSSAKSLTLLPVSSPSFIHLPKRSNEFSDSSTKALVATPYSVDLDYVKVNISLTSGGYEIDLDSRQLNAVDWLGELGRLDSLDFTSLEDLKDKATDRFNIYDREYTYPIRDRAPAKGISRWLNFIDTIIDMAFDYFFPSGGIEIPSTEDDIHILRAYSGGGWKADSSERAFIPQVPGGTSADRYALAFNILCAVLDGVSILIPLDILPNDECQATLLVNVVDGLYENANLVGSVEDFQVIAAPVFVEITSGFAKCLADYAIKNFLKFVAKASQKSAMEVAKWISFYKWVEIAGKTGQIIERGVRLALYATPLESAFVVVGSPFGCHKLDPNCDGCIDSEELAIAEEMWRNGEITMVELMEAIAIWKGCTSNSRLIDNEDGTITQIRYDGSRLMWLKDANYAQTSGYDADGRMTWDEALAWIASLNSSNHLGYNDWRLPAPLPVNATSYDLDWSCDGSTDIGYNITSPNSEMSYMYYVELGNLGYHAPDPPDCTFPQPSWGLSNTSYFYNLMNTGWTPGDPRMDAAAYWTGTTNPLDQNAAFDFRFKYGDQSAHDKSYDNYVWAVRNDEGYQEPLPDLEIKDVQACYFYSDHLYACIDVTVVNSGNAGSPAYSIGGKWTFSCVDPGFPSTWSFEKADPDGIKAGEEQTLSLCKSYPSNWCPPIRVKWVKVDSKDEVIESDENNNMVTDEVQLVPCP